jgi:pimeloyl-ACP methyl ester carboxylesterase
VSGPLIDRAFLRTPDGLVHYRSAGDRQAVSTPPLILAHGGPGSSLGLSPLMRDLAADRRVVAPDMMGNGDSDPPPSATTTIEFYAEKLIAVMDHLELDRVDLYGHHTGAQVICELAIAHPERVRRLVLDGVGLFPPDLRAEFLARYAPPISPDAGGDHLAWVWRFITETTQHFPHYRVDDAHRVEGGAAPPPPVATDRAAEVLKVWSTYHLAYQAAFSHDLENRLGLVPAPSLVLAVNRDPLAVYAPRAAELLAHGRLTAIPMTERARAIRAFLS